MARPASTLPAGDALLAAATILLAALTALAAIGLREGAPPSCRAPASPATSVAHERPAPAAPEATSRDLAFQD